MSLDLKQLITAISFPDEQTGSHLGMLNIWMSSNLKAMCHH